MPVPSTRHAQGSDFVLPVVTITLGVKDGDADPVQRGATGNDLWLGFSHHFADVQQCMMRIIGTVRLVVLICQRSKHGGRYSIWSDDARRLWP